MAVVKHPYQVCDVVLAVPVGTRPRSNPRGSVATSARRRRARSALQTTESGFYARLADDEVRVQVTVVYQDGPRRGFVGSTALMSARTLDTTDDDGTPIRYALELVGGVLYARVVAVATRGRPACRRAHPVLTAVSSDP
jgi:hypothetical protein